MNTQYTSKLLIDEPPLQVLPSLAQAIGLNEAIFLQQLHFRLRIATVMADDQPWIHKTAEEWSAEMPFWSIPTIRRIVTSLREMALIITRDDLNQMKADRTLWYSIDYGKIPTDDFVTWGHDFVSPGDQLDQPMLSNRSHGQTRGGDQVDHTNNIRSKETDQKRGKKTDEDDEALALFKDCYHRLGKFPPTIQEKRGRELLALAEQLIEDFGLEDCLRHLTVMAERNNAMILEGDKKGIGSPVQYLAALMRNDQAQEESKATPGSPGSTVEKNYPLTPEGHKIIEDFMDSKGYRIIEIDGERFKEYYTIAGGNDAN